MSLEYKHGLIEREEAERLRLELIEKERREMSIYRRRLLDEDLPERDIKIYNLGEGFEFNCSTPYSKQYFPLSEEIKQIIKL